MSGDWGKSRDEEVDVAQVRDWKRKKIRRRTEESRKRLKSGVRVASCALGMSWFCFEADRVLWEQGRPR